MVLVNFLKSLALPRHRHVATLVYGLLLATGLQSCSPGKPFASWSTSLQGVYSAEFSYDGRHALVGSFQHGGSLWRTEDAERLYNWNHQAGIATAITASAFSFDGNYAVTANERTVVLWDVEQGSALRYFNTPDDILNLALTPNASKALVGLVNGNAVLFDIQAGGIINEFSQGGKILSLSISPDGHFALVGLNDKRARIWNLITGELVRDISTKGPVQTVSLSENGELAFIASQQGEASIWNVGSGELQSELDFRNPFFPNFSAFKTARFNHSSTQLLTGNSTGALEIWSTITGERIKRWVAPRQSMWKPSVFPVVAVAMHESGQQVLAMTSNGKAYQYDFIPN